jgi:hypothetical protein
MKNLPIILFLFFKSYSFAQNYTVASIPTELTEKAHAVVRLTETSFYIKNIGEAEERVRTVITILDENGKDHATEVVGYDKLTKIKNFEGRIYDADGKKVKSLKNSEITDMAAWSAGTIHSDNRMKIGDFSYSKYPFTVEFEYETVTTNMMFYPRWFPKEDEGTSVEVANLKIITSPDAELRFKELNGIQKGTITILPNGGKEYNWSIKKQPVAEYEPMASTWTSAGPGVLTAPTEFMVEGYRGRMTSWKEYGSFLSKLNEGRDVLSDETVSNVKSLVNNISDPKEKVKKVYEYLQSHVRYVSIQLGIGGWQPFEAKTVASNGYGDCKALSNYTKAMLKAIGIQSHYAVIYGGERSMPVIEDFPASYFNHAVLCVPMQRDTVWLECTSQTNSYGYQGDFTGDRKALIVTDEGGKLVNTTKYRAKDNLQNRKIDIKILDDGNAKAEVLTKYTGIQQDNHEAKINNNTPEEQKKWLYKNINLPSFNISDFSLKHTKGRIPVVDERLILEVNKYATKSGTRIFINPNLLSQVKTVPNLSENRKTDFVIMTSYIDTDSVNIDLPLNYSMESMISPIKIETLFGTYEAKAEVKNGKLIYIRKMQMERGTYPPTMYKEYIDFRKKIVKADKSQVVLINKT